MKVKALCLGALGICFAALTNAETDSSSDKIVYTTGSVTITEQDVHHYVQERIKNGIKASAFESTAGIAKSIENLSVLRALGVEARKQGVTSTPQVEWELALERDRLLFQALVEKMTAGQINKIDWVQAAREEYIANPKKFQSDEEVKVSHILVSIQDRSKEEALILAEKILQKAKAGEDFTGLVKIYSDDPSAAQNNGDMGYFGRRKMVKPFEQAAFAMTEPDQLSEPVLSQYGYHIIKFHDRREPSIRDFEEVKDTLIADLQRKIPSRIREDLMMKARSPKEAKLDEALLEELAKHYSKN